MMIAFTPQKQVAECLTLRPPLMELNTSSLEIKYPSMSRELIPRVSREAMSLPMPRTNLHLR